VNRDGYWCILGRTSTDIIKCGGYKLSALEIEAHLLQHSAIGEVAVLGLPDDVYGEIVVAVCAPAPNRTLPTLQELNEWAREHMAAYKLPKQLHKMTEIPRNAMGKVNKKALRAML